LRKKKENKQIINGDNLYINEESTRSFSIEISGKTFKTPFFIPAISSIKTDWDIIKYINLLKKIGYPGVLVSAYDIYKLENKEKNGLIESLSDCSNKGILIFLDNGNYEAYWYRDKTWTLSKLKSILDVIYPDFCFSFDVFWDKNENIKKHIDETIKLIAKTASIQKTGTTIVLIHSKQELFPKIIRRIVDYINPEIIAIPERELGSSIFERSQTIKRIRDELDKTKKPIPLHILGTGDPISILIYTLCGADMYDAVVWYTNCIDPETGHLYHFSQRDLINCQCQACKISGLSYEYQTIAHNLVFYLDFLEKIRDSIKKEKIEDILNVYLNKDTLSKLKRIMGSND